MTLFSFCYTSTKMKYTKIILLFLGIVFLIGCAHFESQSQAAFKYISWQKRQIEIKKNKKFIISGMLSITHDKKRDMASFIWQQNQNNYIINILGPLHLSNIKIIGTGDQIELCQSGKACVYKSLSQLEWQLPISSMRYWILGLLAPVKAEKIRCDEYGHLTVVLQQNWKINYSDFQAINKMDLPSMIILQNKKFFIKLKIKKYLFG